MTTDCTHVSATACYCVELLIMGTVFEWDAANLVLPIGECQAESQAQAVNFRAPRVVGDGQEPYMYVMVFAECLEGGPLACCCSNTTQLHTHNKTPILIMCYHITRSKRGSDLLPMLCWTYSSSHADTRRSGDSNEHLKP